MDGSGPAEQCETDRSDTTVIFSDRRIGRNQVDDPIDGSFEEWEVILAEGARWEVDVDATNGFAKCGLSGKQGHGRAENRVAALRLSVEEEAL